LETAYDYVELNEEIESLVSRKTDCLYFGTLAQRNFTTRRTIRHFFDRDIKFFCDLNIRQNFYTKELIRDCLAACNVLKLNVEELRLVNELLFNKRFDTNETPKRLLDDYRIEQLCITNGDQGAVIYQGDRNNYYRLKTENVIDTVGAGDAYAAILCLGYLKEWDICKTNEIASGFAGEIVKIPGALPIDQALYDKYKPLVKE
jgi:fructokinase